MASGVRLTSGPDEIEAKIDLTHRALRTSLRPDEVKSGGSYRVEARSGTMAAGLAAGAPIVAVRWAAPNMLMVLRRLLFTAGTLGTSFAQGGVIIDVIRASGWTVNDTGGAPLAWTVNKTNAKATRFPATQFAAFGEIRNSTTATLTAGTRTLDTNPFGAIVGSVGAAPALVLVPPPGVLYDALPGMQPEEFRLNEGFVIRATVPATGTWTFSYTIEWDEVSIADWIGA